MYLQKYLTPGSEVREVVVVLEKDAVRTIEANPERSRLVLSNLGPSPVGVAFTKDAKIATVMLPMAGPPLVLAEPSYLGPIILVGPGRIGVVEFLSGV